MIQSSDIIEFDTPGFDGDKYLQMQQEEIRNRIEKFSGKLYLEIGGKFLYDPHAARVLPGFYPDSKKRIFRSFAANADLIFCVNAKDIQNNRHLDSKGVSYIEATLAMIDEIKNELSITPKISINRVSDENADSVKSYKAILAAKGLESYSRYEIASYPADVDTVLSSEGYGGDEYIPSEKNLILVVGAASGSGKMSTCLGQVYKDHQKGIESGYAKYETFPIWNLHLEHPINLAYEAATADIGDYNVLDLYHMNAYREESVNYNRDVEAFEIVQELADNFLPDHNYTRSYMSPTDMGISTAGFCITDESIVSEASIAEILRRQQWYLQDGDQKSVELCNTLLEKIPS